MINYNANILALVKFFFETKMQISSRSQTHVFTFGFRDSIVVSISACHADDPGSIPGRGAFFHYYEEAP